MNEPPPLPRWFWWLPVLAVAAWWPLQPYWQSDDFLALHYAQDFRHVLADFAGPQYAATDLWLFYRPLVTLSFWVDQLLGGADPFVSHISNVLAHGASALLAGLLWRRFLPDARAFGAGLLWALLPGHVGSLAWAVGRVDSHTTVWCLLALWLFTRQCEHARAAATVPRRWPAVLAATLALASKELAFTLPPLALGLGALLAPDGPLRQRLRFAWTAAWPLWLLFAGYLGFRHLVLGRFGGYLGATYDASSMAVGLGTIVANTVVPMRWIGADLATHWLGGSAAVWSWIATVPLLFAAVAVALRPRRLVAAAALFLVAAAPMAPFFADAGNVHNLRYFYLPSVALAGLLAAPGWLPIGLCLLAWLLPFVAVRSEQVQADRDSAAMHRALLRQAADGAPSPMFVAGLPHANATGTAVQLHFGVDRMLLPPFGPGGTELRALRPLAEAPGVFRLTPADDPPFALPGGSTWFFADATALGRAPAAAPRPDDLLVEGDTDGWLDLTSPRLLAMATEAAATYSNRAPSFGLRTRPGRPQCFRLTIFTASGYLCCLFADHGPPDADHGTIDMLRFFAGDATKEPKLEAARFGAANAQFVGEGLSVPTTIDLVPEFPVLVEAGTVRLPSLEFVPTHRARRLLWFRFDRGYAAWVRTVQGTGR